MPVPPMYMPGRLRTGSKPSKTVICDAEYSALIKPILPDKRPKTKPVYLEQNQTIELKKKRRETRREVVVERPTKTPNFVAQKKQAADDDMARLGQLCLRIFEEFHELAV